MSNTQGDGDVTADLVYVNFGMQDDYRTLERLGVNVKGKIVIARYGSGWRGLKPKLAQDHGAVGCIIYSDPAEDGYSIDEPYPTGPMRPAHGLQRGSVADMQLYPGDPLTPGVGATENAKRLRISAAPSILKIPVLPTGWADAQVFPAGRWAAARRPRRGWRGALPLTYHVGPGPAVAHLMVKSDWRLRPVYDVIAMMPGADLSRTSGWCAATITTVLCLGASDPLSGQVALMAEAQAIGGLVKAGWRAASGPIVYTGVGDGEEPDCSWDRRNGPRPTPADLKKEDACSM